MTKKYDLRIMDFKESQLVRIIGLDWGDYELFRDIQLMGDRDDGNVLYRGELTSFDDDPPIDLVLCTEGYDDPLEVVFGFNREGYVGTYGLVTEENTHWGEYLFINRGFFEHVVIPQAREVDIWDVSRDWEKERHPEIDWDRWWSIMEAMSRAWPHPTHPDYQ